MIVNAFCAESLLDDEPEFEEDPELDPDPELGTDELSTHAVESPALMT